MHDVCGSNVPYRGSRAERLVISGPQGALHECEGVGAEELIDSMQLVQIYIQTSSLSTNLHSDITIEEIWSSELTKAKQE